MNQNILYERLGIEAKELQEFCRTAQISELCLFGAILRHYFNSDSDIDILNNYRNQL